MFVNKVTLKSMASDLEMNHSTLSRFLNFKSDISHAKALKIMNYLNLGVSDYSELTNVVSADDIELINRINNLKPIRKKLIIENIRRNFG